jgi:hypothetical protein
VDGCDLLLLQDVTREECYDQQHDEDEECPCCEQLLLASVALCELSQSMFDFVKSANGSAVVPSGSEASSRAASVR